MSVDPLGEEVWRGSTLGRCCTRPSSRPGHPGWPSAGCRSGSWTCCPRQGFLSFQHCQSLDDHPLFLAPRLGEELELQLLRPASELQRRFLKGFTQVHYQQALPLCLCLWSGLLWSSKWVTGIGLTNLDKNEQTPLSTFLGFINLS